MTYNIFREHWKIFKDAITTPLTKEQLTNGFYIDGSIPQSWQAYQKERNVKTLNRGDYEERLINFSESPSIEPYFNSILIIRGGIGSGKSTTLNYVLQHSRFCHNCTPIEICDGKLPFLLHLDFLPDKIATATSQLDDYDPSNISIDDEKRLWTIVSSHLAYLRSKYNDLSESQEVCAFWKWLKLNEKSITTACILKLLEKHRHDIDNSEQNYAALVAGRKVFIDACSIMDLCYYILWMIKFIRKDYKNHCNYVILDNVDTLPPYLQEKVINFALDVHLILVCKLIMTMRPHTAKLNALATSHREVIEHNSADHFAVLSKRIDSLNHPNATNLELAMHDHAARMLEKISNNVFLKTIFASTVGISIRFAQRNFYNLFLSPLLMATEDTSNIDDWSTSQFYEAYFCTETKSLLMYEVAYCNLLTLKKLDAVNKISTLKIRILHHLQVLDNQSSLLRDLVQDLRLFGYQEDDILAAINDLLNPRTPLIWSDSAIRYNIPDVNRLHYVILSPLGKSYYEKVLIDPLYIRECVFSYHEKRFPGISESTAVIVDLLKSIAHNDYQEILSYIGKQRLFQYRDKYENITCIGKYLWDNLSPKLKALARGAAEVKIDDMYGEYLWMKLKDKLYPEDIA